MEDKKDSLLYDGDIGVAMKLSDDSGFGRINTPMRDAIAARITEKAVEEEMRILYVALTRARERLIVTAHPPRQTADGLMDTVQLYSSSLTRYNVMRARSYIEWILSSLYLSPARFDDCATCTVIPDVEIPQGHGRRRENAAQEEYDENEVARLEAEFRSRFDFVYPHRDRAKLPAKLSVSVLSPVVLDEDKQEDRFVQKTAGTQDKLAAERGTATHCFLQFCDFAQGKRRGAAEELHRLVEHRFLSPDTAELCRIDELEKFFQSKLLDDLTEAQKIYREQRFNIFLPAGLFTEDSAYRSAIEDEKILVQGVIDLFFIDRDGKLILCDYKTDRLSEKEIESDALLAYVMKQRHGEQLTYYTLALEQLMGRKPDRVLVYATAAGRAVEVRL
jgi:ATP-dependent helicase/nuclease subunit A